MGDGYWNREAVAHQSVSLLKRPRSDYDLSPSSVPPVHDMHNYLAGQDDHGGPQIIKDTKTIGSAYDRYLQSSQLYPLPPREASDYSGLGLGRAAGGGSISGLPTHDPIVTGQCGAVGPELATNGSGMGYGHQLPVDTMARPLETVRLPPDASSTLYVEGLPPDSTRREVAHIFRPFVGYKEVRLVRKESKHRGGEPLILCFVDFVEAACAATALTALQGYKVDDNDPESPYLRLQFSRHPGPRSGPGSRGRR